MSYICIAMIILNLLFLPLLFLPIDVATAADASPSFDYFVDDRVPLPSSYQASSAPSPLPYIAYMSIFICCTRHLLLLCYNPILMHSLSLSPFDVPAFILCCLLYHIIFSSKP